MANFEVSTSEISGYTVGITRTEVDLGIKGKEGVLESEASREAFLADLRALRVNMSETSAGPKTTEQGYGRNYHVDII